MANSCSSFRSRWLDFGICIELAQDKKKPVIFVAHLARLAVMKTFDMRILGIGSALVDVLFRLPHDTFLERLGLARGSMTLVDSLTSNKILNAFVNERFTEMSGGSAANTVCGLAQLGSSAGFFGKTGSDRLGSFFSEELNMSGVVPHLITSASEPTGLAVTFISPDSERTFATCLGAASMMTPEELTPALFRDYDLVHLEGYLVFNPTLLARIVELAKQEGLMVSLDMASFNVVDDNLPLFRQLVYETADFVFANEQEAAAFTGKNPEDSLRDLAGSGRVAVVKIGKDGSLVARNREVVKVPARPANVVDTTGAGDLYAAGFLHGIDKGASLSVCAAIGSVVASRVIEAPGAKIAHDGWASVRREVAQLLKG